jgi:hypothetical protein
MRPPDRKANVGAALRRHQREGELRKDSGSRERHGPGRIAAGVDGQICIEHFEAVRPIYILALDLLGQLKCVSCR